MITFLSCTVHFEYEYSEKYSFNVFQGRFPVTGGNCNFNYTKENTLNRNLGGKAEKLIPAVLGSLLQILNFHGSWNMVNEMVGIS